jgi:hypothetical protein
LFGADFHFPASLCRKAEKGAVMTSGWQMVDWFRSSCQGNLISVSDVEIQDESGQTVCLARCTSVLINVPGDEKFLSKAE